MGEDERMFSFVTGRDRPQGHPLLDELCGQSIIHTRVAARGTTPTDVELPVTPPSGCAIRGCWAPRSRTPRCIREGGCT